MMTDRELMQQALEGWDSPAGFPKLVEAMEAMRERLTPPERKPLTEERIEELYSFWVVDCQDIVGFARAVERASRNWVGLTDEEITEIAATPAAIPGSYVFSFARAIEAMLKEKNNGQ